MSNDFVTHTSPLNINTVDDFEFTPFMFFLNKGQSPSCLFENGILPKKGDKVEMVCYEVNETDSGTAIKCIWKAVTPQPDQFKGE